jgi:hypothetical protein
LRKFALLTFACAVLLFANLFGSLFANFASAQQGDITAGGSTLMSVNRPSDLASFQPPQEKNGTYVSLGADIFHVWRRYGLNIESSWRYRQGNYYGYETYRPIFTDGNVLYQYKLARKTKLDLMGGIGVASNRFDLLAGCASPGCVNYISSNHFMEHLGFGVRYDVWHRLPHVFVRAEGHYYHIQNNLGFDTNSVFRVGASVGYNFGSK